jgi:hypothetical protein
LAKRERERAAIRRRHLRGQSMTEFALVFPILMILLVAVADFSRIFAASIVIEAAARNAAEIAAMEYAQDPPGDPALTPPQRLASPAPDPGDPAYYDELNLQAARVACVESRSLPNTDFREADTTCPTWPVVRVCVHDNVGNNKCGQPITPGFDASIPSECSAVPPPTSTEWDPSMQGGPSETSRYVEVRVCYKFTPILPGAPFLPLGDMYIQRIRTFTVACWQDPVSASC